MPNGIILWFYKRLWTPRETVLCVDCAGIFRPHTKVSIVMITNLDPFFAAEAAYHAAAEPFLLDKANRDRLRAELHAADELSDPLCGAATQAWDAVMKVMPTTHAGHVAKELLRQADELGIVGDDERGGHYADMDEAA